MSEKTSSCACNKMSCKEKKTQYSVMNDWPCLSLPSDSYNSHLFIKTSCIENVTHEGKNKTRWLSSIKAIKLAIKDQQLLQT